MKSKIRVAVLRGGPSSEYEVSLNTGAGVLANLPEDKYQGIDILIDRKGIWHLNGLPVELKDLHAKIDVVFIALHGEYGEDGEVQKILETFGVPFTGSKSLASALGMNKILAKKIFKQFGIPTPHYKVVERHEIESMEKTAHHLWKTFIQPSVVKPATTGSSVGVSMVHSVHDMEAALKKAFEYGDKVLVEECIKGKEGTCGVLEHFRGQDIYPLLPVEIRKREGHDFFDYEEKYSDTNHEIEICPGNFSPKESEEMQRLAVEVHKAIGARHYSRTDFMVHPKRGVFCLEINTLPGLTPNSLVPKEMIAIGSTYKELLDHLLTLALSKK